MKNKDSNVDVSWRFNERFHSKMVGVHHNVTGRHDR